MNWKIKYSILGLAFWLLLFLGWEWWRSHPKVRLKPISFPETKEARIDSLLIQSLSQYMIPGLAVGIIENEKVTYLKAFGFQNLNEKDSLSLQSRIPVASVSKLFTALCLADFALENGISIDSSFNSVLPKGKKFPQEFDQISFQDLLDHTSGISDNRKITNFLIGQEKRKLGLLPQHLKSPDPENKEYHYADANFDLIGYVLEVCAKQPFENLINERTLTTAGMENSHFATEWPLETNSISGYKRTFLWKRIQPMNLKLERFPSPSSGLVLSPEDLSKALLHLSRGEMGTFDEELAWLKTNSESPAGFQKIRLNNATYWGHFGEQGGYSSLVLYSPNLDIGFFLVTNSQDRFDFRQLISSGILKIITK